MYQGAALFDFDGTLIQSYRFRRYAHLKVCKFLLQYLGNQGYDSKESLLLELINKIELEMSEKRIYDRNLWRKEVIRRYVGSPPAVSPVILNNASILLWETVNERSFLYAGVKGILSSLQEHKVLLGLVSDTDGLKGMKHKRIAKSRIQGYFNAVVVAGEDTREVKPNIQPFHKVCELLKVSPSKCVYIGDKIEVDARGAKEAGMTSIIIGDDIKLLSTKRVYPDYFYTREDIVKLTDLILQLLTKNSPIKSVNTRTNQT